MIVALAGGVGGAKLADGLYRTLPANHLAVVVNTADDLDLFGLRVCPDLDTVTYTLAGLANPTTGWGIAGDTFAALAMLGRYGRDVWLQLGDRDLATHLARTERLRAGASLTAVTAELTSALGINAAILPMCDEPVATQVATPEGTLDFQDYFVHRHQADTVTGIVFRGIERAQVSAAVRRALAEAAAVVVCPSNPIVSIGPILAVSGMRERLDAHPGPKVAVSPIVGGRALRGPADRMLASLGHEVSAYGVAALYQGLIDGMVIDEVDAALAPRIEALGMRVLVAPTVMADADDRPALARRVLAFCARIGRTT
ncbi:MAG TPA: 2-phospho-L-lactate transferase [Chloroflexota bacterium]|nr:2-phospho-L-lactate transferase [Chloroflexota bacterium]